MVEKSKERLEITGEFFTPEDLVESMLDRLEKVDPDVWKNPDSKWLDPAAGHGALLIGVKKRLIDAGHNEQHILENMLFAVDIMPDNIEVLQHRLGYLIDDQPNPILNPFHFLEEELTHECFLLNPENVYFYQHHRNIVCANSLEYDFSFWRKPDGSEYTEEELKLKERQKNLLEM